MAFTAPAAAAPRVALVSDGVAGLGVDELVEELLLVAAGFACTVSSTAHPGHTVHQAFNRNDVFLLREPTSADRHHQPYEEWTA